MNLGDIVKGMAPTIATALGGPLAGAAVTFLADKLGASDKTQEAVSQIIQGVDPVKMKQLDYEFQEHMASLGIQLQLAQIGVNTEEAKSTNWFVAGGRPFIMWTCGIAFAYATVIEPICRFIAQVLYGYNGSFPVLNTDLTMQVLMGLLGLGAYRTFEKFKGVESNR